ncbi:MAG TPA: Flp family type IVb pilin [Allosphingosinicella sp.]|nr:Flp family type IVb pilin [Allosphingosinicella sp.]
MRIFEKLRRDERGATAVEYGLIVALIVVFAMAAIMRFSNGVIGTWNIVTTNVVANM